MARTSRVNDSYILHFGANELAKKGWRVAVYIRLSKEDGNDESLSVINQRKLLLDYVDRCGEDFETVDCYIDDGLTGTNTDREAFKRLLDDIHDKKINCVIVKDLSRFARNYVDAGHLLENEFIIHDVRFICLSPQLDSFLYPDAMNSVLVPILNVMNDDFCRQTSNKVKAIFTMKMKDGEHIGAFAPYGYVKDKNNKSKFVIDDRAAEVVRNIYNWFVLDGMSKNGIARRLNGLGVLTPSAYKRSIDINYTQKFRNEQNIWIERTVSQILKNCAYIGNMAQGKSKKISYKLKKKRITDPSEWIIVEGTHEPIISKELFEKAQDLQKRDTRTAPQKNNVYLFSGFLRCNECKKTVKRKASGKYIYYDCSTYLVRTNNLCTKRTIKEDKLIKAVITAIKHQINLAVCYDKLLEEINAQPIINQKAKSYENDIKNKKTELAKIVSLKEGLYTDWKSGDISKEDYQNMRSSFDNKAERLKIVIYNLENEQVQLKENADKSNPFLTNFLKYKDFEELDRDILVSLVNVIYIAENGNINIEFKYQDEFIRLAQFVEGSKLITA